MDSSKMSNMLILGAIEAEKYKKQAGAELGQAQVELCWANI